jgi:hypothetical protein
MQLLPYHQRLLRALESPYPNYARAVNATARASRWFPLWMLLQQRFKGLDGWEGFSDYEVGALLRLKDEYEGGFSRRG